MNNWARMFFRGRQGTLKSRQAAAKKPRAKDPRTDKDAYLPTQEEIAERAKELRRAKGIVDDE